MLKIEQIDELEILPGIVWAITWASIDVHLDDDGDIEQIDLLGGPAHAPRKITLHHSCQYPELWRGLCAAIAREQAEAIQDHVESVRRDCPDPNYGRLLETEML